MQEFTTAKRKTFNPQIDNYDVNIGCKKGEKFFGKTNLYIEYKKKIVQPVLYQRATFS